MMYHNILEYIFITIINNTIVLTRKFTAASPHIRILINENIT